MDGEAVQNVPGARLHLLGVELATLRQWLVDNGQPRYRAEQITDWIYAKGATTFEQMTNLSKALRAWLDGHAEIYRSQVSVESAATDGTHKLLLTWPDGQSIETVWIPEEGRDTACLSSQVGCAVGCRFCASGLDGVQRNLTAGEIVEQALRVRHLVAAASGGTAATEPARLSNIVLMGMGEPLANYDAVLAAVRILNAPWGLNIGARKITLSTVGLPKQIRRLADEGLQLNLALSLHAPDQELRERLIPWGKSADFGPARRVRVLFRANRAGGHARVRAARRRELRTAACGATGADRQRAALQREPVAVQPGPGAAVWTAEHGDGVRVSTGVAGTGRKRTSPDIAGAGHRCGVRAIAAP